jgi:hypothetical protein
MEKTCCYCDKHAWHDEKRNHICIRDSSDKDLKETCDLWRENRRGYVGCIDPDHEHIVDYDQICGHVKDDKYTRRK